MARLFFALWPDEGIRSRLSTTIDTWPISGRRIPRDNLHCTLVFVGSVSAQTEARLSAAAEGIELPAFELILDSAGFWAKPKIAWLGAEYPPPALQLLAETLATAARDSGIRVDERPFKPHVTVFRKVSRHADIPGPMAIRWQAGSFALVQSVTEPGGARYRPLRQWRLAEKQ